jgi:prepilin-type N-terminal cleavage/methylation domain-containing protein
MDSGFSLIELLVVIAILALVAMVTTPSFIRWRNNAKLRGAAENVRGALELAKARAARENSRVVVSFSSDRYEIFVDNGDGTDGMPDNGERDGEEPLVRDQQLPPGVRIDFSHPDYSFSDSSHKASFGPRGTANNGTLVLVNEKGTSRHLTVSILGKIRLD